MYLFSANGTTGDTVGPVVDGITIDATITNSADVLIDSAEDLRINAAITTASGNIGLFARSADGDITQTSAGDVTATAGDILIIAGRDWTMAGDAEVSAGGDATEAADILARAGRTITLGVISGTSDLQNRIAIEAVTGDILDANGGSINIREIPATVLESAVTTTVSLRAVAGIIGGPEVTNGAVTGNVNAIDTNIDTLAALSRSGIYVSESNDLVIDDVPSVTVLVATAQQVHFNSTQSAVPVSYSIATLEDLVTTDNGPVKVVTRDGSITVNAGTSSTFGISANGTGDVLLEARDDLDNGITEADIRVTGNVFS